MSKTKTISTPLVLATASAMICLGLVAALGPRFFMKRPEAPPEARERSYPNATPEAAAESYLDAYRSRDHAAALALSVGEAQRRARARQEQDLRATPEEREAKARLWDRMAASRLALDVTARSEGEGGSLHLEGVARGRFLENPYRREVSFELERHGDIYLVSRMELGAILEGPRVAGPGTVETQ